MNIHALRSGLSNRKSTNQSFLFGGKIDLDGKLVETIMLLKRIEAFESYLEVLDELYDKGSTISQKTDKFIEIDRKNLISLKEVNIVKEVRTLKKLVRYQGRTCYAPRERLNCFFFQLHFLFLFKR